MESHKITRLTRIEDRLYLTVKQGHDKQVFVWTELKGIKPAFKLGQNEELLTDGSTLWKVGLEKYFQGKGKQQTCKKCQDDFFEALAKCPVCYSHDSYLIAENRFYKKEQEQRMLRFSHLDVETGAIMYE